MLLTLEQIKTALNAVLTTANINIEKLKLYVDDKFTKNNEETDDKINTVSSKIVGRITNDNGAEIFNDYENNIATADYSHASGYKTKTTGYASHVEGYGSKVDGISSHAEGYFTIASGDYAHAEGGSSEAYGSYSHAEGHYTYASGNSSHAEGNYTYASGESSHAEGNSTSAGGNYAHAEGSDTFAPGDYSHVEGQGTTASSIHQHVQGKYNIKDESSKYAHIVGNGSYSRHSNAHTLDWDGNAWYSGTLKLGGTSYDNASEVALKKDIPTVPSKTSDLINDSGFLNEKPTYTAAEVGADSKGTASSTVSTHNTASDAHSDIRLLISDLTTIINTILNSEDVDLDQLSEIVAYIKSNRSLIEQVTTNKINVSDIIDNLTTNVANKPLSAKQGVALKALIDAIKVPTKLSELSNDKGYITKAPVEVAVQSGTPSEGALWVDTDGEGEIILAEIDDTTYSSEKTWSSNKIKSEMTGLNEKLVQQGNTISNFSEEIAGIPNNELLVQNVAQKVPYVKVAEHPIFVNSVDEMTDISKMYVLKLDGMFYSYKAHTTTTPGGTVANFTNKVPTSIDTDGGIFNDTGYKNNARLSSSGGVKEGETGEYNTLFGYIPAKGGDTIRFKSVSKNGKDVIWYATDNSMNYICAYDANFNFIYTANSTGSYDSSKLIESVSLDGSVSVIKLKNVANIAYIRMSVNNSYSLNDIIGESAIITVNEEITYTTTEEGTTTTYSWESTGISYNQPADYEHRVIAMENELEVLLNGTF